MRPYPETLFMEACRNAIILKSFPQVTIAQAVRRSRLFATCVLAGQGILLDAKSQLRVGTGRGRARSRVKALLMIIFRKGRSLCSHHLVAILHAPNSIF